MIKFLYSLLILLAFSTALFGQTADKKLEEQTKLEIKLLEEILEDANKMMEKLGVVK